MTQPRHTSRSTESLAEIFDGLIETSKDTPADRDVEYDVDTDIVWNGSQRRAVFTLEASVDFDLLPPMSEGRAAA